MKIIISINYQEPFFYFNVWSRKFETNEFPELTGNYKASSTDLKEAVEEAARRGFTTLTLTIVD